MRTEPWFAFVDLSTFARFGDEHGDDESVRVLTAFRGSCGLTRSRRVLPGPEAPGHAWPDRLKLQKSGPGALRERRVRTSAPDAGPTWDLPPVGIHDELQSPVC